MPVTRVTCHSSVMLRRIGRMTFQSITQSLLLGVALGFVSLYIVLRSVDWLLEAHVSGRHVPLRTTHEMTSGHWEGGYPASLVSALSPQTSNGYLVGNRTQLSFHSYGPDVDLRIIVIVFNRTASLVKCLRSLNRVIYGESRVSLHVWLDRDYSTHEVNQDTYHAAKSFNFTRGQYHVHIQSSPVGIQGQWTNTWRPALGTTEIAVIIEDDLTVSPYIWRWLHGASLAYGHRNDVSGFGLAGPGIEHKDGGSLDIPRHEHVYLYRVICTWGFAPNAQSWRQFQNWFYRVDQNASFEPLVPGILPSQWFLGEKTNGRERALWEMWHIYYTHNTLPPQFTVLANTKDEGRFAINRHENGLHDTGQGIVRDTLCEHWNPIYDQFPRQPTKYDYSGKVYRGSFDNTTLRLP